MIDKVLTYMGKWLGGSEIWVNDIDMFPHKIWQMTLNRYIIPVAQIWFRQLLLTLVVKSKNDLCCIFN
jgi:hypothetical protein